MKKVTTKVATENLTKAAIGHILAYQNATILVTTFCSEPHIRPLPDFEAQDYLYEPQHCIERLK